MQALIFGLYVLISLIVSYQDFKTRSIHILTILGYLLILIPFKLFLSHINWIDIFMNFIFLSIILGATFLVAFLRYSNVKLIGTGDILFLAVQAFYFPFLDFIICVNVGLVISLVMHGIMTLLSKSYKKTSLIPLAGFLTPTFTLVLAAQIYARPVSTYFY